MDAVAQDVSAIKLDVKKALAVLDAQSTMLATLLQAADNLAPRLIVFLPADAFEGGGAKSRLQKLTSPKDWFNQRVRVFFVDPIHYKLAPTNPDPDGKGQGFELRFPKVWVAKAMPYVRLSLTVLKVAHIGGKVPSARLEHMTCVMGPTRVRLTACMVTQDDASSAVKPVHRAEWDLRARHAPCKAALDGSHLHAVGWLSAHPRPGRSRGRLD